MARLLGPDEGSRLVYAAAGTALGTTSGLQVVFYEDPLGESAADLLTYPGGVAVPLSDTIPTDAVVEGAVLLVDENSLIPLFQFPDDVDTVFCSAGSDVVGWGPIQPVYARTDDRLDAAEEAIGGLPGQVEEAFVYTDTQIGALFPDGTLRFRFGTSLPDDMQAGDVFFQYTAP